MKNLRAISKILGIYVTHKTNRFIKINQDYYIQQVLVEFGMENSKPAPVSLSLSLNLEDQVLGILNTKDHKIYRCLIGRLMFMAIRIRIDIVVAVNRLSQYLSKSREIHLQAAKYVLHYLISAADLGILYQKTGGDLTIYADAAYTNA